MSKISDRSSVSQHHRHESYNRYTRWQNIKVQRDGEYFNTCLSGFKYDDFTRTGYVSLQKLLTLVQSACGAFLHLENEVTAKGLRLFMFGSHYTFSRQLFDRAAVEFPMRQRSSLAGVGRTSVDLYRVLETAGSPGTVLLTGVVRLVCVDFARGISAPVPDGSKLYLSPASASTERRFPRVEVPESAPVGSFSTTVRVLYDDIDFNWHTNQASYTAFALECAARAAAAEYYSRIRDDIAFYPARSLTCVHLAESFAGDELSVSTWQDAANRRCCTFSSKDNNARSATSRLSLTSEL